MRQHFEPEAENARLRAGALGALILAGAALWASSLAGRFQFDDFAAILGSGMIGGAPLSAGESAGAIRPLTQLTFWIERQLFGHDPAGYHLLSIALHLGSCLLVWRIARRLVARARAAPSRVALFAALLFLVHPLATEAVTYLSGRSSLLAAFLSLLAVDRWQEWRARRTEGDGEPRPPWGSLAAFALALCAKETAAVVPLALLLTDIASDAESARAPLALRLRAYLPHLLLLTFFFASAALHPVYRRLLTHSLALRAPGENLAVQPRVALEALTLWFRPDRLNFDHDLRAEAIHASSVALGTIAVAALALGAHFSLRRRSAAGFGVAWFLLHLLPTCSFVARNDLLSERNLYLPSAGLAIAVAALGVELVHGLSASLAEHRLRLAVLAVRALATAVAALIVAALATGTLRRNALYADPVALWSDAARKSPHKARPHANLGSSLEAAGRFDAAIEEYRVALRLDPDDGPTRDHLLRAWEERKRRSILAIGPGRAGGLEQLSAPRTPAVE